MAKLQSILSYEQIIYRLDHEFPQFMRYREFMGVVDYSYHKDEEKEYTCSSCSHQESKLLDRCPNCGKLNSFEPSSMSKITLTGEQLNDLLEKESLEPLD